MDWKNETENGWPEVIVVGVHSEVVAGYVRTKKIKNKSNLFGYSMCVWSRVCQVITHSECIVMSVWVWVLQCVCVCVISDYAFRMYCYVWMSVNFTVCVLYHVIIHSEFIIMSVWMWVLQYVCVISYLSSDYTFRIYNYVCMVVSITICVLYHICQVIYSKFIIMFVWMCFIFRKCLFSYLCLDSQN